ncbi:MAG: TonB-dependent receptor [Bacteroidetes bacterium]|nr:TonB-dependent receptor [Bacteroidota bacterium]
MKKMIRCASGPLSLPPSILKMLLLMKITIALILITALQVTARDGNAQTVTLQVKQVEIPKVFKAIEHQSPYRFLYNYDLAALQKKIDVNVKDMPFTTFLNNVLAGTGLSYKMMNSKLVVIVSGGEEKNLSVSNISGTVLSENGQVLSGVSVRIKGSNFGTSTNGNGYFSLEVPENSVLEFSYVGYQTQTIEINGQQSLNIILKLNDRQLDQVVVVGYGSQKKKDVTGAIASISNKELENRPNDNFANSIEGKAAGVQVIRPSGQPQAVVSIRVRGTSTITAGSEPLYILDGVPTTSINEINPADIESFTVLKDASSAAIYGSSGSNGVVLITTKRGKNQKSKITLNTYMGNSQIAKRLTPLNADQYKSLMADMGLTTDWTQYTANTNWQDKVLREGKMQNYQLSITGGNENTGYYISGSWMKEDGIVISNTINRANFKINFDHKVSKRLKIGTNISYNRWYDVDVTENSINGSIMSLLLGTPVIGVFDDKGQYTTNPLIPDLENPVALAEGLDHGFKNYRFNGNVFAEFSILPSLKFKSTFGYEQYSGEYNSFRDPFKTLEGRKTNGEAEQSTNSSTYWITENTLNFTKGINKHNFSALGGFVISDAQSSSLYLATKGFANVGAPSVNNGSELLGRSADFSERKNVSAISRVNYSYDEKYLFTGNFRADASSVFGAANRWGYFPSFSAGWRISQENFFKQIKNINDLKLRAGWGLVGNDQIPAYGQFGLVNPNGSYPIGGVLVPGIIPTTLENKNLKWETTDQTDIGLDVAAFQSRILLTADYYIKNTKNLLFNRPIPTSVGYGVITGTSSTTTALQNIGTVQNKGIEFQVTTKNLVGKFKWSTDFNISFNRNKVISIDGDSALIANISERGNMSKIKAGLPLGSFYGYISDGVDPLTGNMIYRDLDKSGDLSEGDKTIIGNANPNYIFGITNDFAYQNWSLNIFIQGVQGNDIFNATRIATEGMFDGRNQSSAVLNRWKTSGQATNMPKADIGNPYNTLVSSRFVENGSYVRIKSLSLSYHLPARLLKQLKLTDFKLYATAENLFTFTKYTGFDPEVSAFGNSGDNQERNAAIGVDYGTYPQTRSFIFGLSLTL